MGRDLGSRLSIASLAREVAVSVPPLSRRFRQVAYLRPKAMLKVLQRALELLCATDLALNKRDRAGFGYKRLSAFRRPFVQVPGVAPVHWKDLVLNLQNAIGPKLSTRL
jgi:transcriptional regulator GlxA family with amidase domain